MRKTAIVERYRAQLVQLEELTLFLAEEVEEHLERQGTKIHSVTSRVKAQQSLEEKLARPDRVYRGLFDVTDVVGLRVITYFDDTVEEVAAALEGLYEVDVRHSVDKREALDSTRFGYQSLHYVCRLPDGRLPSALDGALEGVRFEVQIRTMLQHAWAEIEHDLGYKNGVSVPSRIRRRFSRLAGLLEIVDEEFITIRDFLERYEQEVKGRIREPGSGLPIDRLSLSSFMESDIVAGVDRAVAARIGKPLGENLFFPDYLIKMLTFLELDTVDDLAQTLERLESEVADFVEPYLEVTHEVWGFGAGDMAAVPRGYSLLLMGHLLALGSQPLALRRLETMTAFFHLLDSPEDEAEARRVATLFVERLS